MEKLLTAVSLLVAQNALHRRKEVRINDLTTAQIFNHAHSELCELYEAITNWDAKKAAWARAMPATASAFPHPDDATAEAALDEIGDVFCILAHVMERQGWTVEQVEEAALLKLKARWRNILR